MKLKMWKRVIATALPLVAVVAFPVVLTSCSSTTTTIQPINYQPDEPTDKESSELDSKL